MLNISVLILIVVDNGLELLCLLLLNVMKSLNPYCSGQWSRTSLSDNVQLNAEGLNPYCSGQWSRTRPYKTLLIINKLKNFSKETFTFLN